MIGIRLLGRFAVERDGEEIARREFGGKLARRLLRLLALRRGTLVLKDLIAEALWPEQPPANAAGNIEVLVSRLRGALGDRTLIRTGPGGYVLAEDDRCWVDVEVFLAAVRAGQANLAARPAQALTAFRAALGIWQGEPLPEDTYAGWAQADRWVLSVAYLEALDGAASAALGSVGAAGAAEAAGWARRALALEPLRESSVLLLVRGLAAAGDHVGALATFDEYRNRLATETGLDPTARAHEVRQRVLVDQPAADRPHLSQKAVTSTHRSAPRRRDSGRGGATAGRQEQCALSREAAAGGPRAALVTGSPGVGRHAPRAGAVRQADLSVLTDQAATTAVTVSPGGQIPGIGVSGLPSQWRDLLSQLALLGRPAPPALLAAASSTDLVTVLATLQGLSVAGLASLGPQGWTPSPDPGCQMVSAALRPAEKARIHAQLATALRQCGSDPAEAAVHQAASGDTDQAALTYVTAARRQLERICDREAMGLAETGLSLDPVGRTRAVLLEVRGEVRRRGGQLAAARDDFTAALDSLDDPASRSEVLAKLAILDARTADAARGGELAELAIAEAGDEPAPLAQALAASAIVDLTEGNLARARHRARRAARLLDQAGDRHGSARLLYWRAMACFMAGRLPDAVIRLDRLVHLPVTRSEVLRLWNPHATRGHALALLGQAAEGLAEIDQTLVWAHTIHHPAIEAGCLWRRSEAQSLLGQAAEAIESAEESASIAARIGHAEWTAAAHRGLGIAYETAGMPEHAEAAYRRSLDAAERIPIFRAWADARLGALLARQQQPRQAAPHVRAALAGGTPLTLHEARWAHAELLASRGQQRAAHATATAALQHARRGGYLVLTPRLRELAGH